MTGSHDDVQVIERAFAGADSVFWVVPPDLRVADVVEHYRGFTQAACTAVRSQGVGRVVAVSSMGRDAGELSGRAGNLTAAFMMDAMFEATGVAYRSLQMPFFKDNLLGQVESIGARGVFSMTNAADRALATVATADVAAAAAAVLLDEGWDGQDGITVAGPDDLSPEQMAQVMTEVLERPVRYERATPEELTARMERFGIPSSSARGLVAMTDAQDAGIYDHADRTSSLPVQPTTFPRWCHDVLRPAVLA